MIFREHKHLLGNSEIKLEKKIGEAPLTIFITFYAGFCGTNSFF
jgi:hypothetical protein